MTPEEQNEDRPKVNKMAELELKLIAINPDEKERLKFIDEFLTLWEIRSKPL